jgi:Domain of unknown function (DUF932)
MSEGMLIAGLDTTGRLSRQQLAVVPTPPSTATHQVIPHVEIVNSLEEALGFRHISVQSEEYAVSKDGKNFFGVMTLDQGFHGAQFALGVRNSHSKQFRLSVVVGMRVLVCSNLCFSGDFDIVLQKHSKNMNLKAAISVGLDEAQRGFEPLKQRVQSWKETTVTDDQARISIFKSFIEGDLDCPKYIAKDVWRYWMLPTEEEFEPRTRYSLQNCYTSAFKSLDPLPAYKAAASLAKCFS